jgi:hypothetical protein
VGFTIGSRGKVPGKTCEKRIRNNNNNNTLQAVKMNCTSLGYLWQLSQKTAVKLELQREPLRLITS